VAALETGPSGPFSQEMRELGYSEGKNLLIEWRFAEGELERLADLAAELASLKMDVIVAPGTQAISALQKATRTTPIVMVSINDPVGSALSRAWPVPEATSPGFRT